MAEERQRAAAEREGLEKEAAGKLEGVRLQLDATLARDRQTSSQAERSMEAASEAWQKVQHCILEALPISQGHPPDCLESCKHPIPVNPSNPSHLHQYPSSELANLVATFAPLLLNTHSRCSMVL